MDCVRIGGDFVVLGDRFRDRKSMDSQSATIDGLMDAISKVQRRTQRRLGNPVFVVAHFVFGGVAVVAFLSVMLCRLAGHQIGDELTNEYVTSLATSVLFFAVGTLMIERMHGDVFGGFLGRALAGCGLFVMSVQGYEFMQKTKACEIEHQLLAKQKATPVSETATFVALRSIELSNGMCVEWEHENGRSRPVSITDRRTVASRDRIQPSTANSGRASRRVDSLPRRTSGITTGTNGDAETF